MNKNIIERKNKALENRLDIIEWKAVVTFFVGLGLKVLIGVIGFFIGTWAQTEGSIIHLKIDNAFNALGSIVFGIALLMVLIFAIRGYKVKSQQDILKSIQ